LDARRARVIQSYGPFQDVHGVTHWVDLLLFTVSLPFAFGSPAFPFAVFPVRELLLPPPTPSHLTLGPGSVWFLADLLSAALPSGNFTGFIITGGTFTSSAPMNFESGVYVAPVGATLTVKVSLSQSASPPNPSGVGADAVAAIFKPPTEVTIRFEQTGATFVAVDAASAQLYGSVISLAWSGGTPVQAAGLPLVVVPCHFSPTNLGFSTVHSTQFVPSGTASITRAGWALQLTATSVNNLPEGAGPGTALIEFAGGASVHAVIEPKSVPVTNGLVEVGTGFLYVLVTGRAKPAKTIDQLWPQTAPSKLNATAEFHTAQTFIFAFLC
jgi:hypothetical protein